MSVIAKERKTKTKVVKPEVPEPEPESGFEKAIILRPIEMNVGSIKTNIDAVLAAVKEKSEQYQDVTKYQGDEKQAKEDRALLRKQKEATKTTIASIQQEWDKPLETFLNGARQILKQFDLAIDTIDEWVKEGEAQEKERKYQEIQAFFDTKDFNLVPLTRFFDNRWLNKTYKMPEIKKEIESAISEIYTNIKILENIADYGMTTKAFYLETLDMGEAMRRVEALRSNAERLAKEKVERDAREVQAQVAQNAKEERLEERDTEREERAKSLVNEALGIPEPELDIPTQPKIYEFSLRLRVTMEQMERLKAYITENGIAYERIA